MSAALAYTSIPDSTLVRSSRPLLKGLCGPPMTGETAAVNGSRMSRGDFERIEMDTDATRGTGGLTRVAPELSRADRAAATGDFAEVFDLAEARKRRMTGPDRIPDEVWDDITRAAQLADDLSAHGQSVRF